MIGSLLSVPGDAPLTPSPDEADSLLRRELLRPEYHDDNPVQQLMRWLSRQIDAGIDKASSAPPLGSLGALVAFLALLVLVGWLVSRTRRTARVPRPAGAVLTDETATADDLRARALAALERGDAAAAVVDAFRALTLRQIERGVLDEQPGATAHEVARALAVALPPMAAPIAHAADLFDLVLYGDRPATPDQARTVLALDDDLVGVR